MKLLDFIIIALFFIGFTISGFYFSLKKPNIREFMDGGKHFPTWSISFSLFATYYSSLALISVPELAFKKNLSSLCVFFTIPLASILTSYFFVPLYIKKGYISAYTHLKYIFGDWATIYTSLCYIATNILRIGLILYLLSLSLSQLLGVNEGFLILFIGMITISYTYTGGFRAVIWTDVAQAIIMLLGTSILLIFIMSIRRNYFKSTNKYSDTQQFFQKQYAEALI